jgi:hypothetical protein
MYEALNRAQEASTAADVARLAEHLSGRAPLSPEHIAALDERFQELQRRVGYDGNYSAWIRRHVPKRLEDLLQLSVSEEP